MANTSSSKKKYMVYLAERHFRKAKFSKFDILKCDNSVLTRAYPTQLVLVAVLFVNSRIGQNLALVHFSPQSWSIVGNNLLLNLHLSII